ncbi:MAG: acyl-CoA/acyl-ACP dehydrogenase, partial [Chrysiogenetes bacterium]|nr:acyl-CoA/acyl-ACP dehydrogenase [Chrysiogenetes bacterium]
MGLVLTEEQAALKDAARKFAQQKTPVTEMRRLRDSGDATGFDKKLWQEMAQLGWAGILVPEDFGGAGLGYRELGVVFEELGRTLAQTPLLSTAALAVTAINAAGSDAQKKALLEKIATGELLVALAVDEGPQHRPAHIALKAEKAGGGYKLSGEKTLVFEGNAADRFIVAARTSGRPGEEGGITLFLVAADAPGVSVAPTHLVDSRRAANVVFENAEAGEILGAVDGGYEALEKTLDAGRALLAAEMLG